MQGISVGTKCPSKYLPWLPSWIIEMGKAWEGREPQSITKAASHSVEVFGNRSIWFMGSVESSGCTLPFFCVVFWPISILSDNKQYCTKVRWLNHKVEVKDKAFWFSSYFSILMGDLVAAWKVAWWWENWSNWEISSWSWKMKVGNSHGGEGKEKWNDSYWLRTTVLIRRLTAWHPFIWAQGATVISLTASPVHLAATKRKLLKHAFPDVCNSSIIPH